MYIACLCPNLVSVHFYAIRILHFKFPKFFIYLYMYGTEMCMVTGHVHTHTHTHTHVLHPPFLLLSFRHPPSPSFTSSLSPPPSLHSPPLPTSLPSPSLPPSPPLTWQPDEALMRRSYSSLSVGSTRSSLTSENPTLPPEVGREGGGGGEREGGGRKRECICVLPLIKTHFAVPNQPFKLGHLTNQDTTNQDAH